jgi:sortase A
LSQRAKTWGESFAANASVQAGAAANICVSRLRELGGNAKAWISFRTEAADTRRWAAKLLMAGGTVLLIYVGLQYYTMFSGQRQLANEFEQQQKHPSTIVASENRNEVVAANDNPLDDGLTRLSIPKIDLDAIVVEGTTSKDLLLGPGHIEYTPEPGSSGNVGISAHRDTFFRHIYELQRGDIIDVQRGGKTYRYEVTGKKIVEPSDVSVLGQTTDARLTLVTCYPTYYIGPAPERLVVFSKLASNSAETHERPLAKPTAATATATSAK